MLHIRVFSGRVSKWWQISQYICDNNLSHECYLSDYDVSAAAEKSLTIRKMELWWLSDYSVSPKSQLTSLDVSCDVTVPRYANWPRPRLEWHQRARTEEVTESAVDSLRTRIYMVAAVAVAAAATINLTLDSGQWRLTLHSRSLITTRVTIWPRSALRHPMIAALIVV